jgi:hypothetical protein
LVSTSVGGKTRTGSDGDAAKGWDHDPPAKEKLTPFGILVVASGALMLLFGSGETSDAWADALQAWWRQVRAGLGPIKRLVIYLDNGPKNSGRRTQFLKRMVEFADWSGLEVRLVYYPPVSARCYQPQASLPRGLLRREHRGTSPGWSLPDSQPFRDEVARRCWRFSFCLAAFRRDSSRRCFSTDSG